MAAMSLDDWLKSQNAYYLDGGYEPDQAYKQLFAGAYDQYKRQADLDAFGGRQTYSGKALNLITPESIGWANVGVQGGGGIQYGTDSDGGGQYLRYFAPTGLMPFLSEQNGVLGYNSGSEDDSEFTILRDTSGNPITKKSIGLNIGNDQDYGFSSYQDAKNTYSSGYVPWNIDNVYEGLSNRQHFNLNALWGGTQYAQGRVTDWSHLDPTQYQSNVIAANTRNELWNEYDKLAAEGKRPAKNPDEVALDFYVKNVGPSGNTFGYGPGANTALITEAVKHQFLNSPDVIQARGTTYQTPQEKMAKIDEFGTAHQAGVPTWQVFEKQQYGSGGFNLGSLIPMIIGGMALGPMAGAFGGGLAGNALAGALIGGTTAEIGGGDFLKGALTGGIGGGLASSIPGLSSEVASALDVSQPVADAITKAATTAVRAGLSGGDVEQAILGSLVNSGVGGAVSEGLAGSDVPQDLVKTISNIATPVISTAIQGGDVETALTNSLIKGGLSLAKDASWGVNEQPSQDIGDMIGSETPFDMDDAEIGVGVDLNKYIEDPNDFLPLGYESREDVAAANPDLYQGGVLPDSGMMTTFNPDGTVEYVPQTPVDTYYPSGGISGGTSGGSGSTSGGIPTAATQAASQAAGVNYGTLMDKISNILNPQQPKYDSPIKPYIQPTALSSSQPAQQGKDYSQIIGELSSVLAKRGYKVGGEVRHEDNPVEYVEGPEDRYYARHMKRGFAVNGPGTGQSDDIPTMLSDSEFVIPADVVSALGEGSSKAGSEKLYEMMYAIRKRARSTGVEDIPPPAFDSPLDYLKKENKSVSKK
jgi:hypothetical protein